MSSRRYPSRDASRPKSRPARHAASRFRRYGRLVGAAIVLALAVSPALAGLRIVEHGVEVDRSGGTASFSVLFDAAPDLFTRDEFDRPADSFQYEVDADGPVSAEFPVGSIEAVIRGDEIPFADALRVRAAGEDVEPDPDPIAGGWGPVRAEVPFDLDGPRLSFDVPLEALGDDDGRFAYRLFTVEFGTTVDQVEGVAGAPANPIPLPPAFWPACLTTALLALVGSVRGSRRFAAVKA